MRPTSSRGSCSRGESSRIFRTEPTGVPASAKPRPPVRPSVAWMKVRRFTCSEVRVLPGVTSGFFDGVLLGVASKLFPGAGDEVQVEPVSEADEIEQHVRDLLADPGACLGRQGGGLLI